LLLLITDYYYFNISNTNPFIDLFLPNKIIKNPVFSHAWWNSLSQNEYHSFPKLTNEQFYCATYYRRFSAVINFLNENNYVNHYTYTYTIDFTTINNGYQDGIHMDFSDYISINPISENFVGKESWYLKPYYSIFGRPKIYNEYLRMRFSIIFFY